MTSTVLLNPEERIGHFVRAQDYPGFQDCMNQCGMIDMRRTRSYFTLNYKQNGEHRVFCKLYIAMVNQAWADTFPNAVAHFMPDGQFDHCLIMVVVYPVLDPG